MLITIIGQGRDFEQEPIQPLIFSPLLLKTKKEDIDFCCFCGLADQI
jgi:hypothetical protein